MTDDFDVRSEILSAVSRTDDPKDRAILLLMLGVLERVERWFNDETSLQEKVLNGLTVRHKTDHEWIDQLRVFNFSKACAWVDRKMKEEESVASQRADVKNAAIKGFAVKMAEYAAVGVVAAVTYRFVG